MCRFRELLEDALADDLDENLTDEQYKLSIEERYNEILAICGSYPNLDIDVAVKGESIAAVIAIDWLYLVS